MLKSLLNFEGVQLLDKAAQKTIQGGTANPGLDCGHIVDCHVPD